MSGMLLLEIKISSHLISSHLISSHLKHLSLKDIPHKKSKSQSKTL